MAAVLFRRVLSGYGDIRASLRAERAENPPEARLLAWVTFACLLIFAARLPTLVAAAPEAIAAGEGTMPAYLGASFVAHVFFAPLLFYGFAAAARLIAQAAGGRSTWKDARLALFWSLLLSVPFTILANAAAVALGGPVALVLTTAPLLPFLWFWSVCLAEVEGFRDTRRVAAALLALPASALLLLWLAGRG
jgi:hypothetical protein